MNKLLWYLYRFKNVPLIEYYYRFKQEIQKRLDKILLYKKEKWGHGDAYRADIKRVDISGFEESFPNSKKEIIQTAEKILGHNFNIFGIEKDFGDPINWHLDPKRNKSWPLKFWGDIKYRDGKTVGGIKFAWELNRLHHLPQLAIAFSISGESKYKKEIFTQLKSWLDSNPYPEGINWIMGIELGIRIVNVVYAIKFLDVSSLTKSEQELISYFISLHGKHLYRYPSKYSSCANHAIAEALGLFVAGLCFPTLSQAYQWKIYGKKVLEREITKQIYPDGSNFEHSVHYLQFILDHFLLYLLFCKEHQLNYNQAIEERIKASLNFISAILDSRSNYPSIGDEDEGYLMKLWFGNHNNFVSLLNTGAILFDNSRWILDNSKFDQKTYFLLGKGAKEKWNNLKRKKFFYIIKSQYFRNAGLAVFRDRNKSDVLFIGNCGPLGLKPLAGHGHADALSFWLSINGQPIFIDPGTYLYHSGGAWRSYFRSTSAHNTIRVDKHDQATIISDFIFKNFYKIKDCYFKENDDKIVWSAGHDGYMRLRGPVFHKREILYFKKKGKFVINDYLYCRTNHLIECFFHFHPDCCVSKDKQFFCVKCGSAEVRIKVDKKWSQKKIFKGELQPSLEGWYSRSFNQIEESQTLLLGCYIDRSESFHSEIYVL